MRAFQRHLPLARIGADHAGRLPAQDKDAGLPLGSYRGRAPGVEGADADANGVETSASPRVRLPWSGTNDLPGGGVGCSEWARVAAPLLSTGTVGRVGRGAFTLGLSQNRA